MERSENQKKIIDKAKFYGENEILAHVLTVPKGTFKNGIFISELEDETFFWFVERDTKLPIRLFLSEIHDIDDYQERDWF